MFHFEDKVQEFIFKQNFAWLIGELERLSWPEIVFSNQIVGSELNKNRPTMRKAMKQIGYEFVPSGMTKDGRAKIEGKRVMVYARLPNQS